MGAAAQYQRPSYVLKGREVMNTSHTIALIASLTLASSALAKGPPSWVDHGVLSHSNQDGPAGRSMAPGQPFLGTLDVNQKPNDAPKKPGDLLLFDIWATPSTMAMPLFNITQILTLGDAVDSLHSPPMDAPWSDLHHVAGSPQFGTPTVSGEHIWVSLPATVPSPAAIALLGVGAVFGRSRRRRR
jgi:MYXO-CTERM domain-containing protein